MLGIDPTQLGGGRREYTADPPIIWPDMADGYALFLLMATQWNWVSLGMAGAIKTGLRYEVLEPVARAQSIELTRRVFSDVQTLESEALTVWSARR